MKDNKRAKLFLLLLFFCLIATRVSLGDLRVIRVSADKPPDEFTELFDVEASNANADPIQFTIILKNNRKWEGLELKGGKKVKVVRGLVQTARVEIIRHDPYRMAVEFPLVFKSDDQNSQSTTFKIEHDLLRDATAKIIVATTKRTARISGSGRERQAAELAPYPQVGSFLMCDWEGCTTGTIGLPNPNKVVSRKRPGSSILIYIGTPWGRFPRERILALGREGIKWNSRRGRESRCFQRA